MLARGERRVKDEEMAGLTTTTVERFIKAGTPLGKPHATLRDGGGLCLRLLPSGAASWQFVYRLRGAGRSGTQKTVTLGSWPGIDVRKAAEEARRLAGEVAAGRDPRAEIRAAKRRERAVVALALDDYGEWVEGRQLRAAKLMMSLLRRGLSHLLQRDLAELDRVLLIDAIERIKRSGRPRRRVTSESICARSSTGQLLARRDLGRSARRVFYASRDQGRRARGRGTRKIVERGRDPGRLARRRRTSTADRSAASCKWGF